MTSFLRSTFIYIAAAASASCSSPVVSCGGRIYPDKVGADALEIVRKATEDSKEFCVESSSGCDFTVAKTNKGWSVAAARTFAVDGKCVSRLGDEKFYSYDESGVFIRSIDGI